MEGRSGTGARMEKRKMRGKRALVVRASRTEWWWTAVGRASCGLVIPASETMALASRLPDWDGEVSCGISCFLLNNCAGPLQLGVVPGPSHLTTHHSSFLACLRPAWALPSILGLSRLPDGLPPTTYHLPSYQVEVAVTVYGSEAIDGHDSGLLLGIRNINHSDNSNNNNNNSSLTSMAICEPEANVIQGRNTKSHQMIACDTNKACTDCSVSLVFAGTR